MIKFNRYWISDKSGIGREKWYYFTGDFDDDKAYARDWILERYESWAQWADSYSMEVELDVEPTQEFIRQTLNEYDQKALYYANTRNDLIKLLKD